MRMITVSIISFIPQRLNWIEPCGFEGGEQAGNDADGCAKGDGNAHRLGSNRRAIGNRAHRLQYLNETKGGSHAECCAEEGNDNAFDQDLSKNSQAGSTYGFADADLAD